MEKKVTLTQMLKALNPKDATRVETKLKKLSKKKAFAPNLDKSKADAIERKIAYDVAHKEVDKWDKLVGERRKAKSLSYPVNEPHNKLDKPSVDLVNDLEPKTQLEKDVKTVIEKSDFVLHDKQEMSNAEKKYLNAISLVEAQERHRHLQKMRALISCYGAKMKRQKAIKSKSYRRLLKHEKIRKHVKNVESDKDLLKEEIERLQRLRAQERASLKHKNTGKWAKHAKFKSKYDEKAREAMMEQIGIAETLRRKPKVLRDSKDDSDDIDSDDLPDTEIEESENETSDSDTIESGSDDDNVDISRKGEKDKSSNEATNSGESELVVSTELLDSKSSKKRRHSESNTFNSDSDEDDEDEEDEQRKLMSEAFAGEDVVEEFRKAKEQAMDEEQPKDKDTFLPGWGSWIGPGVKATSKKKRSKFVIKAARVKRRDEKLGNVIISEQTEGKIKQYLPKKLPRGFKDDAHFKRKMNKPVAATFTNQLSHRQATKPKVSVKLGARVDPLDKAILKANKAKWVG